MKKPAKTTLEVKGTAITVLSQNETDYICLTDIARYKDADRTDYLISNWLRNRNTAEFLGIREQLHNPGFNPIEFDGISNQTGWLKASFPEQRVIGGVVMPVAFCHQGQRPCGIEPRVRRTLGGRTSPHVFRRSTPTGLRPSHDQP